MRARTELATVYQAAPDASQEPRVRDLISAYLAAVMASYDRLGAVTGLRVVFMPVDPYASQPHMAAQVRSTGTLYVYTGGSGELPWAPELNWRMRAVHDALDHLGPDAPDFSFAGEVDAFRRAAARMGDGFAPLLWSEIVLQAAAGVAGGAVGQKVVIDEGMGR